MNTARSPNSSPHLNGQGSAAETVPLRIDLSAINAVERAEHGLAALRATAADDHERRASLLAALAIAQSLSDPERVPETLADAAQAAERAGTPVAAVHLAMARYAIDLSPEALPCRIEFADTAMTLLALPECDDIRADLLPLAYFMHLGSLMESGDTDALDAALSPEVHLTDLFSQVLHTRYALWFRCARATMDGQLPLAEKLAHEGHALALAHDDIDAEYVWAGQMAIIRWMQGRISEMESVFVQARRADPTEPIWAASVAWIWSHQGRTTAARGLIESLPDMSESPRGRNWLAALAILAEVAADIGSDELVERLRQTLLPFADRVVSAGLGIVCWGTAARPLALLARRQGRHDEARSRYRDAIALCSRIGAQAWLAQAQVEYGALELERGNVVAARSLADESASAAYHLGLHAVEQRARRLLEVIEAAPSDDANSLDRQIRTAVYPAIGGLPASLQPPDAPRITVLGEFTVTPPDSAPAVWRSRKARTLLQILVAQRGAPLSRESAMHLLWPDIDPDRLRNRFSVALTAIRRALDPEREHPADTYIVADAEVLRLREDRLSVDVEDFLSLAESARTVDTDPAERGRLLRSTVAAYSGEAFPDEPYAAWAQPLRRQAHLAFFATAHALAELAADAGDHLERSELYRRILQMDPYDQQAHEGLITALMDLGATGHVTAAREERDRRMAELGLPGFGNGG